MIKVWKGSVLMKEFILKERIEFAEYKSESLVSDFKVIEVNVSDATESLPALVNPVKLNF
ncbi:hypothetical protein [Bacillus sp. LL01]|uniref:hypothetical protein n=1 Tax=Bacillus sp. LL01 TaxID=1665556 RepID=UPI0018E31B23|nr:hypothetical protein [Bacillus sp. LL01]